MRTMLLTLCVSLAVSACGAAASPSQPGQPGQIQATPAVQQTTLPKASPAKDDYGY